MPADRSDSESDDHVEFGNDSSGDVSDKANSMDVEDAIVQTIRPRPVELPVINGAENAASKEASAAGDSIPFAQRTTDLPNGHNFSRRKSSMGFRHQRNLGVSNSAPMLKHCRTALVTDSERDPMEAESMGHSLLSVGRSFASCGRSYSSSWRTCTSSQPTGWPKHSMRSTVGSASSTWTPLASSWRHQDALSDRPDIDNGSAFVDGAVPHWGKGSSVRTCASLAHELTWLFYKQKQSKIPVAEKSSLNNQLPKCQVSLRTATAPGSWTPSPAKAKDVTTNMTGRQRDRFQFWRDLQPPFTVCQVHKADDGMTRHPDGELHFVTFECGLDYNSERMWGMQKQNWTYDNKLHSVAEVRIPDNFPEKRPIKLISWGSPVLNWSPDNGRGEGGQAQMPVMAPVVTRAPPQKLRGRTVRDGFPLPVTRRATIVQAATHSPIARELSLRPDHPRLAQVRDVTRRCSIPKRSLSVIEVPENLREHVEQSADFSETFPELSRRISQQAITDCSLPRSISLCDVAGSSKPLRKHIVFTSAGGFVDFDG